MKKKARRFNDGGYTGDDPIVKYRMGMIDAQGNPINKGPREDIIEDESERGMVSPAAADFNKGTGNEPSRPKSVERTVVKTKVTPSPKSDAEDTKSPVSSKSKSETVKQLKEVIGGGSMPKSFTAAGGNTKASRTSVDMPSMKISIPDPLAGFDAKGKRYSGRDTDDRRKGGVIKKMSSGGTASKRADGIAMRGKTRGKIC